MGEGAIKYIPLSELHPHPKNPRLELGDLTELAESIKARGILQNLTVVERDAGGYTVIIGHRRCAASKLAGLTEVPCMIVEMTMREQVATMMLENVQRSDLTVYEQSKGFQMLLDLGETVSGISEKTGFSETTIRRRVKMQELDQDKLKAVSERQLSLGDFDRLAQIEDIKERNKLLGDIGTNNFDMRISSAIRKQAIGKAVPLVKAEIKKLHANKISWSETYNGKYDQLGKTVELDKYDGGPLVKDGETRKLYYYLDEANGIVKIYVERPKAKPVKRPQAEIDREKAIADAWNEANRLNMAACALRVNFLADLKITKTNMPLVLRGAVIAGANALISYIDRDYDFCNRHICALPEDITEGEYLFAIAATFGEGKNMRFCSWFSGAFPSRNTSKNLGMLYDWLVSLGYEMSDEEKALLDGTHEIYRRGDTWKAK